jgi:hypothetical protein
VLNVVMAGWRNHDLRLFRQVWNQLKAGDISLGDRAYGSSGIESPPSSVMCYTPQALSALKLTPAANASMNVCFQVATGAVCHIEYTPHSVRLNGKPWAAPPLMPMGK